MSGTPAVLASHLAPSWSVRVSMPPWGKRQTLLPAGPDRKERSIVRRPWLLPGCMGTMEQPVMAPMVSRRERQGSQRE